MSSTENTLIFDLKKSKEVYDGFRRFYPKKSIPPPYCFNKSKSNDQNLSYLSIHLLDNKACLCDLFAYKPLIIELVARLIFTPKLERDFLELNNITFAIEGTQVLSSLSAILTYTQEISTLTEHFLDSRDFFNSLRNCLKTISQSELQLFLLSFYRLLATDQQRFQKFIDPQLLHSLVTEDATSDINKYISIWILSKYLYLSEDAKYKAIEQHVNQNDLLGSLDGDDNINFRFLPIYEAQRLSNLSKLAVLEDCFETSPFTVTFDESDLSPGVSIISGVVVPNLLSLKSVAPPSELNLSNFVQLPKSLHAIRSFATLTKTSQPVLLAGSAGSGKTFLVDEMAKRLHIEDMNNLVKIHLNQQTDSKTLLGTYTSGTKPGTFEWKNGVLTTAVKEGKWVLVEDIDKAPNEVLSILMSLLEHREITLPSRGEVLKAGNGFQLISTIRTSTTSKDDEVHLPDIIGLRLWNILRLPDLDQNDLKIILNKKFPLLTRYTDLFIKCYFEVKSICNSRKFVSMNKGAQPRQISIRDLMKFCRRSEHIFELQEIKSADDLIHDDVFDTIFQEAIDCFTSAIVEKDPIEVLIKEIGSILQIPTSRINLQLSRHVPVIENFDDAIKVGRALIKKHVMIGLHKYQNKIASGNTTSFATTNHSARLMEKIGVGISMCEPLLLVGETGTGKTTVVQQMAKLLNKKLIVINLSQQTEVGDLLGGFKPINAKTIALPLEEDFEQLFARSFSAKNNEKFLKLLSKCFNKSQWKNVCRLWKEAYKMAKSTFTTTQCETANSEGDEKAEEGRKKKRKLNDYERIELMKEWKAIHSRVTNFEKQAVDTNNSFIFRFVEGSLVNAVKRGDWLLLDEMNLAAPETLDSISDLLAEYQDQRSVLLSEKGDVESIRAHPDFRIFGCMNPATDVGKKDLPQSIRSRFTEIYVASPDQDIQDLLMIIDKYIGKYALSDEWVGNDVAELYLEAKKLSDNNHIVDGANQKPHFSIRTLTRTLLYAREISSIYGLRRSLYEGFCMSLLTLLDEKSERLLMPIIQKYTIGRLKNAKSVLSQIPSDPSTSNTQYIKFGHYWMRKGSEEVEPQPNYIITPFVEKNMMNLVRATSGGKFPILIQGPTSAGKTSMINYLAKISGHKFVRINNHEHTDLQEYLGTYVSDDNGKLIFKEGILVEALRHGHWIVLDELNLAPTDVLEALNRLLDDNRELFIPETQETVRPHPDFMLFATQNPPGLYGGRKVLSKAFRNRFLELHFDDIPQNELEVILRERCRIAPSYAKKIVDVYKELGVKRQSARLFEQKNSFATLRDLFRWAQREAVGYEELAANGYMLLAERVRKPEEKIVVKEALEKVMKVKLNMQQYYSSLEIAELLDLEGPVIWTKAMRRLAVLVMTSLQNNEPLLLVGETGCGKTTVCQMIAKFFKKELIIVNAHQNTETGDLLGAQRPIRNRSELQMKFIDAFKKVAQRHGKFIIEDLSYSDALLQWKQLESSEGILPSEAEEVNLAKRNCESLFEWSDGPLVTAMKNGSYFLLDEISLADDSVLERLNSVLEPERSLLLAEKGSDDIYVIADDGFQFLATMNPGGDYGKKELSPALRNRFTEIWVPSMEDFDDVRQIVSAKLSERMKYLTNPIVEFSKWYGMKMGAGDPSSGVISLRDILAWITFINTASERHIPDMACLLHGACMVFIDALGTHSTAYLAENEETLRDTKFEYVKKLSQLAQHNLVPLFKSNIEIKISDNFLTCGIFSLPRNSCAPKVFSFNLEAPTTASNASRVVRALQVQKPILLEGSPGVGKTSLITALALATGNNLTRINLSEQTDLIDLFGSDAPVEGGKAGEFVWRDAPFLRAMQRGEWVLLDEMNLASQSVLEGLNACLDHRGEVYIPELDKSFTSHPDFKVFAAQNPQLQGGGRKGLPKSFINRFSVVYVDMLTGEDLKLIAHHLYPSLNTEVCDKMITLMSKLEEEVVIKKQWGSSGAPWEFNLRDTLRWLSLVESKGVTNNICPSDFFDLVVRQRLRSEKDREHADNLFKSIFGKIKTKDPYYMIDKNSIQCQNAFVKRNDLLQFQSNAKISHLQCNVPILETIFCCIQQAYPVILVGSSGSGKSALIKYAADVIGSKVYEFSMNSDIDSMDILGGYEQADYSRTLSRYSKEVLDCLLQIIAQNALSSMASSISAVQISTELVKLLKNTNLTFSNLAIVIKSLLKLTEYVKNDKIVALLHDLHEINSRDSTGSLNANFEWFDGLLVEAVEKGYWLILDNANLCSPSVLDRLNSLLETNGTLVINECTNDDGSPRVIQTHPNFRLFLTSDPKHGELSRAMRNRSVEIYIEPLEERTTFKDKQVLGLNCFSPTQDVLCEKMDSLNIQPNHKLITSFIAVNDSALVNTSFFIDFHNMAQYTDNVFLSSTFLQFIPISLVQTVLDFSSTAPNCPEFFDPSLFENIMINAHILKDSGFIDKVSSLYDNVCDPSLSNSAFFNRKSYPVSFLTNESLIPFIEEKYPTAISVDVSYLFIIFSLLTSASSFMRNLREKAGKLNASVLNPLEKLVALSLGREIKNVPSIDVYRWVMEIFTFISDQFSSLIKIENMLNKSKSYEKLFNLLILWNSFVSASSVNDYTAICVYHDKLMKWLEKYKENFDHAKVIKLESFVMEFNGQLKMSTGSSMTIIWNACRDAYPQNGISWQNYELLVRLAESFDAIAYEQFPENIGNVNEFRKMLIGLFHSCMGKTQQNDFVEIADVIKYRIKDLMNISESFLSKRAHPFESYFVSLLGFIESKFNFDKSVFELNDETLSLCLLANKKTIDLIDYEKTELFKPYPKIFKSLWDSNGFIQLPLFDDQFFKSTMILVSDIGKTKGGNIDQTLFDMRLFISQFLKHSEEVLIDHTNLFSSILRQWIKFISDIHVELLESNELRMMAFEHFTIGTMVSLKKYCEIFKQYGFAAYAEIFETYFIPPMLISKKSLSKKSVGECFFLTSCGLIMLYVPDSAYDPAAVDHILYKDFIELQTLVANVKDSFVMARENYFGDNPIFAEEYLPEIGSSSIDEAPRVYRDSHSTEKLFEEWSLFFRSYFDKGHIEFLLDTAEKITDKANSQIDNFIKNTSYFTLRLKENYSKFSDLNDILIGFIHGLKLGLTLLHEGTKDSAISYPSSLWISNTSVVFSPSRLDSAFESSKEVIRKVSVNDPNVERIYSYLLLLFRTEPFTNVDERQNDTFNKVLMSLYYRWSLRILKEKEKESNENGIYRFADSTMDAEADFEKLFPDSDQIIDINASGSISASTDDFSEVYYAIAKAYIAKFDPNASLTSNDLLFACKDAFDSLRKINETSGSNKNSASVLVTIFSLLDQSYKQFTTVKQSSEIDFYHGYDFAQTKYAVSVVRKVQISVSKLLKQWPEHATLSDLFRICTEFLEYPSATPIFRLLAKVEQIFTFIAEWEKYAHSGVSLASLYKSVSELIVSWRQLELASWKQVFTNEEKTIEKRIGKWWFHLFETIIVPVMNEETFEEELEVKITSAINVFLSQATYGELSYRLKLLKSFATHLKSFTSTSTSTPTIRFSLLNIISFYDQFTDQVNDSIDASKKDLEKKVNEIILLASWKDVNIDALKQSSRRSHHSLYKIIRKYRDCLMKPIKPLIENGIPLSTNISVGKSALEKIPIKILEDITKINQLCSEVETWNERNARLKNSVQVEKNMKVYISDIESLQFESLHEFAKAVRERADTLKKETPSVYTKENKKLIGYLKSEKHKLLSDTIKDLKNMGLKLSLTVELQNALPSATAVLATTPSLEETNFSGCDKYFFRLLDLLPRLRSSVSEVHSDINPADSQKCLAASEHLLFSLVKNRAVLLRFSNFNSSLKEILLSLENISITGSNRLVPSSEFKNARNFREQAGLLVKGLPFIIDHAVESLNRASDFTQSKYNTSIFVNAKATILGYDIYSHQIFGSTDFENLQKIGLFYRDFIFKLNEWKQANHEVSFVADFVLEWISAQKFLFEITPFPENNMYNLDSLEQILRQLFNSILVSVQRIHKFNFDTGVNKEDKENHWLSTSNKKLIKSADMLYPISMLKKLNHCIEILQSIEFNEHESILASAMIEHFLPIIQHYFNLVQIVEHKLKESYIDVSRGTFELSSILYNICSKGFCQPEAPSDEKEDNNLKEGTGLGDGEGAQNNSNDVEDDEDLSEEAQKPNEEKNNDDDNIEENDDAVEIEGDMAGDLENASDQENEDENEAENEDNEDLDEEIDNLDDLDPNAIDDKMWDEEASSNSKEKESEEMPDNSEQNDDLQAMEDESEEKETDKEKDDGRQNDQPPNDDDKKEEDQEGEEEEDVGEQQDEVKNEENDQFEHDAPEAEALELPEDMNLDSDGEDNSEEEEKADEKFDDNLDENDAEMKSDEENDNEDGNDGADVEMDHDEVQGDEDDEEVEGKPAEEGGDQEEEEEEEDGAHEMDVEDDGINEDANMQTSDQELQEGEDDDKKEDNTKENNDQQDEIEGLESTESGINNADDESAVKQQSGLKSEGADADADEENDNIGASNGDADFPNEEKEKDEGSKENETESSRNEAAESMKQLGDSLKEFHRRRQEIKEATEDDMVNQKAGERPDEFQHLEGENTETDTQALGAANKDQVQTINDEMAIDDDEEKVMEESEKLPDDENQAKEDIKEESPRAADVDMKDTNTEEDDFAGEKRSGFMKERNNESNENPANNMMDVDSSDSEIDEGEEYESNETNYAAFEKDDEELRPYEEAEELWKRADEATRDLTSSLCEQLRLILEPTLSTKLKGDYKTGKRLNMKRIIPYIASQFRKDKIWMRRTKPSKRQYQIMISLDDSKSMAESHAVDIAFQSVALVSKALSQLESGQLSIMKFGSQSEVVHPFEKQFGGNSGINVFRQFKFDDTRTDIKKLVSKSLKVFNDARAFGDSDLWQLEIVLSDGVCEDHETIQRLVRRAREEKVMIVFVIIDGLNGKESIMGMDQASYVVDDTGKMKLQVNKYLDTFPFEFYVVVHHINELPEMLSLILRQFFTELASS